MPEQRTVFITGATSGIGRACALRLSRAGYRVYGAGRSAPRIAELSALAASGEERPGRSEGDKGAAATRVKTPESAALPFPLFHIDVRNDESVAEAVAYVSADAGGIDAVINCAGISVGGPAEEMTTEEVRDQLETNLLGLIRVCRAVLPIMRERRGGRIINISSLAGQMGLPFQSVYSATKFAVEGFSESLQMEVARYGIRIVVVEPGNAATEQTANRQMSSGHSADSSYGEIAARVMEEQARAEQAGWGPDRIARAVERALSARHPRFRYRPGPLVERISPTVRRILPDRLFLRIVASFFGM
ncbi:SDR family oxidoreductase [Salinispira pacifica]